MLGFSIPGGVYDSDKKKKKQQQPQEAAFPGVRLNVLPTDKDWGTRSNCSIFGISLRKNSTTLPPFLYKTIKWLEKNALMVEGIFRVTASNTEVDGLIALLEKGMDMKQINLDVYKLKPHVVSTTLKRYFRELPEPLLTFDYYYAFIEIRKTQIMEDLIELLHKLDIGNLVVLKFLMRYLFRVQEYADYNKMKADNLAIIFAPSLLRAPLELEPEIVLKNCGMANIIVSTMIFHYHYIFEERLRNRFMAAGLDPEVVSTSWTTYKKGDKKGPNPTTTPPNSKRLISQNSGSNWSCVPSGLKSSSNDLTTKPTSTAPSNPNKQAWIKSTSTPASVMKKHLEQLHLQEQQQQQQLSLSLSQLDSTHSQLSPRSSTMNSMRSPRTDNSPSEWSSSSSPPQQRLNEAPTEVVETRAHRWKTIYRPLSTYTPSPPVIEFTILPRNEMIFCSSFISEGDFIELPYL